MKRYSCLFLTLILLMHGVSSLLALHPEKKISDYSLDELKAYQDIPDHDILSITQSDDGYLWFSCTRGIIRWGWGSLNLYHTSQITGNPALVPWITGSLKDSNGNLWFCGGSGVIQYKNNTFKVVIPIEKLGNLPASSIYQDRSGDIWIGTMGDYLYRYANEKLLHYGKASGLNASLIRVICEDRNGILWITCSPGGLFYGQKGKFNRFPLPETYSTFTVLEDKQGALWVGSDRGLIAMTNPLSPENRKIQIYTTEQGLSSNIVLSLLQDSDNNIWCGTTKGLSRITVKTTGPPVILSCLPDDSIDSLFEDNEKSVWIGTANSGAKRLRDIPFHAGPTVALGILYQDQKGTIWLGNDEGQIFRFQDDQPRLFSANPPNLEMRISSMLQDNEGNFWVGTEFSGLFQLDFKTRMLVRVFPEEKIKRNNPYYSIGLDKKNRVIFCTLGGGLFYYQKGNFGYYSAKDGITETNIFDFYEDTTNNFWIATQNGLLKVENGQWHPKTITHYLKGIQIHEIHGDKTDNSTLWLGSLGQGLIRFKKKRAFAFKTSNGLSNNNIFQIMEDWRENFWLASLNGVMQINKKELNDFADKHGTRNFENMGKEIPTYYDLIIMDFPYTPNINDVENLVHPRIFSISDGLRLPLCTISTRHTILKASESEYWFSTFKGIEKLNIDQLRRNKQPPPIVIQQAIFNGTKIPVTSFQNKQVSLKGISSIRFQFIVLTFFGYEKIRILYKLEGYDKTWKELSPLEPKEVNYQNIPLGTYRFHVIAANGDGVWNMEGATVPFTLAPHFYQTPWFTITMIVLLLALGVGLYLGLKHHYYIRNLKLKYQHSTLDPEKAELTLKKLQFLMEVKHAYREDTLSLQTLAEKLKITPHYLSQVINERTNKNFWEFLNAYRIEEVKKKLLESNHKNSITILDIAFKAGFNSKETFNRAFKKFTGKTPTEFKKQ